MLDFEQNKLMQYAATLGFGALGGFAAYLIGFPAPFLTGSVILITIICLAGVRLAVPNRLRDVCFVAIGLSMGAGVTPDVIDTLSVWPFAFVILVVSLIATFSICRWMLPHFWGFDLKSATLASSPGHLSFILGLSSQSDVDIPSISIVQSIRLMVLTIVVPFVVTALGLSGDTVPVLPFEMDLLSLLWLVPCAVVVGWALGRFKLPAAFLLGGMLISTLTHATGIIEGQIPSWLTIIAFTVMGCLIGTRFSNVTLSQLQRAAGAGLAAVAVAMGMAVLAGLLASWTLGLPLAQLLIAFAPGGLEAMAAMAVIMNVDTTFVAAQHIFRLLILTVLAPAFLAWEDRKPS